MAAAATFIRPPIVLSGDGPVQVRAETGQYFSQMRRKVFLPTLPEVALALSIMQYHDAVRTATFDAMAMLVSATGDPHDDGTLLNGALTTGRRATQELLSYDSVSDMVTALMKMVYKDWMSGPTSGLHGIFCKFFFRNTVNGDIPANLRAVQQHSPSVRDFFLLSRICEQSSISNTRLYNPVGQYTDANRDGLLEAPFFTTNNGSQIPTGFINAPKAPYAVQFDPARSGFEVFPYSLVNRFKSGDDQTISVSFDLLAFVVYVLNYQYGFRVDMRGRCVAQFEQQKLSQLSDRVSVTKGGQVFTHFDVEQFKVKVNVMSEVVRVTGTQGATNTRYVSPSVAPAMATMPLGEGPTASAGIESKVSLGYLDTAQTVQTNAVASSQRLNASISSADYIGNYRRPRSVDAPRNPLFVRSCP
jgi:hypothetical protein